MALNLENPEGERRAPLKRERVAERRTRRLAFLKAEVWSTVPDGQLGRRLTRAEEATILGYGPGGV